MITYYDLVMNPEFREFTMKTLSQEINNPNYYFPNSFPYLYKYQSIKKYAVNNLLNCEMTATSVGEFNDLFDSTVHTFKAEDELFDFQKIKENRIELINFFTTDEKERKLKIEALNAELEEERRNIEYVNRRDSRYRFRLLSYLGTFVISLSTINNSTLMWSHYANNHSGICIEYDFNQFENRSLLYNVLFPVAYSDTPIQISDLIYNNSKEKKYEYQLDSGVLCAALNKSNKWSYENEWRMVFVDSHLNDIRNVKRKQIKLGIKPKTIYFGYHFLKPCHYHNGDTVEDLNTCEQYYNNIIQIIDFAIANNIVICCMKPDIGEYKLIPIKIPAQKLKKCIESHFHNKKKIENIRFYYVLHDTLMELLETEGEEYV